MSFTRGFTQGFGMVNQVINQQDAKERQAMLDERNEARYQEGLKRDEARYADTKDWREKTYQDDMNWKAQGLALQQQQRNIDNSRADRSLSIQEQQAADNYALNKLKTMEARNNIAGQYLDSYLKSGQIDEKGRQALSDSVYAGTFNAVNAIKDDFVSVLNGYDSIQTPEQLVRFANSPKTLKVVNASMRNELYARDNATGKKHEVVALEPAPGGVIPILKITDKKGNVFTAKAPATRNKSSNKDDQIMVVPIPEFRKKIDSTFRFHDYASSDPILKAIFASSDGEYKMNNGYMYNTKTGLGKQVAESESKGLSREQSQAKEALSILQKNLTVIDDLGNKSIRPMNQQEQQEYGRLMSILSPKGGSVPEAPKVDMDKVNKYLRGRNAQ